MIAAWVAGQVGLAVGAVLAAGASTPRRAGASLLLAAGGVLPWLAPPIPLLRVGLAILALVAVPKTIQILADSSPWTLQQRFLHLISLFHVRDTRPAPPSIPTLPLLKLGLHGALACLAFAALVGLRDLQHPSHTAIRWLGAVVLLYSVVAFLWDLTVIGYAARGIAVPPDQFAPLSSRSAQEFWGQRWNTFLAEWLRRFVFLPLARRRQALLGVLCAFAASAAMHGWLAVVPLGWLQGLRMGAFFLLQGVFVVAEMQLNVRSWPQPAARAWAFAVVLGPLPLGIEPFLRVFRL